MTWQEIRAAHPDQWILIEAIAAHTEGDRRVLDDVRAIAEFEDSGTGWHEYGRLHGLEPFRELYVPLAPELRRRLLIGGRQNCGDALM